MLNAMKVFIPLDENQLPPTGSGERLVPYQVGYLVLGAIQGGIATWDWTTPLSELTARTEASKHLHAARPAPGPPPR
jgi:hypothetical protein